jgi:integral membrane sensor domain MASE1/GAF domain-containing protein/DNA-binding CsgD family transcriptional regulator
LETELWLPPSKMSVTYDTTVRSDGHQAPRFHPDVVALILVGLAYFTLAHLGLKLASINPSASPIWPATGLAVAAVVLWGHRIAPAIFVAAFLVNHIATGSIFASIAIACGNSLEALIAGYLVGRWAEGKQAFDTPTGIAKFALISLAATMVSATIGVSSLTLAGHAEVSSFLSVWLTWWLGDLAGALVITPVVVLWAKSEPASLTPPEIAKTGLTYLAAIAVGVIAFSPLLQQMLLNKALGFLVVLPLLGAALRRGPRDTATVALIVSAFVVWCTKMQCGPFALSSMNDSYIVSLAFMITSAVPSLILSTDVAVRRRIENQQRQRALETDMLWQATVQVSFGGSFEDLLRGCLGRICRLTGWAAGHVYRVDDVTNPRGLLPSPVWHFEREELAPLAREIAKNALVVGDGLPDQIFATRKNKWFPNSSAGETTKLIPLKLRKQILLKYGLHAAFGFPLYAEGKLQAILAFFSTTDQQPDEHLLHVVQSIGEQLGRALERERGQEQEREAVATSNALNLATVRSEALEATLNALTFGVYLTDRSGRIVYMNRAAERQVTSSNVVCVENGHLAPIDHTAQLALARAIDEANDEVHSPNNGLTIALPGGDNAGLIATIFPLGCGERQRVCGTSGMEAIFVQDPVAIPSCTGEAFAKLYGLTRCELRVLLAMGPGLSVKEAAEMLGIGETTAKTHLQHIYSKTCTSKRIELMHLFMSCTPPVKSA